MNGDGGQEMAYRPWPEPDMPPYLGRTESRSGDRQMADHSQMRDRNVVNIRDYQDRRQIGFEQAGEGGAEMRQYGRRYNPDRMSAYEAPRQHHEMGHEEGEEGGEHLTREQAEKWVKGMTAEDGKTGGAGCMRKSSDTLRTSASRVKRKSSNFSR